LKLLLLLRDVYDNGDVDEDDGDVLISKVPLP
jgi:hypothetical protein